MVADRLTLKTFPTNLTAWGSSAQDYLAWGPDRSLFAIVGDQIVRFDSQGAVTRIGTVTCQPDRILAWNDYVVVLCTNRVTSTVTSTVYWKP
jgi:hypothetical protein